MATKKEPIKESLVKALMEMGRVALIAAIPILIDGLSNNLIDWKLIGISAIIAVLRFVDKYLHEYGVATKNESLILGLTRF